MAVEHFKYKVKTQFMGTQYGMFLADCNWAEDRTCTMVGGARLKMWWFIIPSVTKPTELEFLTQVHTTMHTWKENGQWHPICCNVNGCYGQSNRQDPPALRA